MDARRLRTALLSGSLAVAGLTMVPSSTYRATGYYYTN
jgi:hypothetical protein